MSNLLFRFMVHGWILTALLSQAFLLEEMGEFIHDLLTVSKCDMAE